MRKGLKTLSFLVILFLITSIFSFFTYPETEKPIETKTSPDFQKDFNENYGIYSISTPQDLQFAGEEFPLLDEQVREALDRELLVNTYWQSQTLLFLKRAKRYFPVIEPILNQYGIPEDFKYLPIIESGLMNVVSPAGAVGFWQLMKGTATDYGLEVNQAVDERYNLEKASHAACQFLVEAHEQLGSWKLAAAAYNMGISGVQKQMERQRADDFFDLTLNEETGRYLYRLVAVKEIISNPAKYGFHLKDDHAYMPIPTEEISIDSALTHVDNFNKVFGLSYRQLKFHNPWLRLEYLPNSNGKVYKIKVPVSSLQRSKNNIEQKDTRK
jgi:membrane-bound lytic murein transglycosylase D